MTIREQPTTSFKLHKEILCKKNLGEIERRAVIIHHQQKSSRRAMAVVWDVLHTYVHGQRQLDNDFFSTYIASCPKAKCAKKSRLDHRFRLRSGRKEGEKNIFWYTFLLELQPFCVYFIKIEMLVALCYFSVWRPPKNEIKSCLGWEVIYLGSSHGTHFLHLRYFERK